MQTINPEIFKAYDIRGVYGKDFDDEDAYKIGLAYSCFIKEENQKDERLKIAVGSDMRLSSPQLKSKLIEGLLDGGVDVIDVGLVSTPTFYYAVVEYAYDGGVLVSASHNPADYNGFKLVRRKALPIGKDTGIMEIRDAVIGGAYHKDPNGRGQLSEKKGAVVEQVQHDLKYGDLSKIKKMKVVIDTANAMGATYFDELFKYLPAEVVKMNWELDGNFPNHEADPYKYENIKFLCAKIKEEGADLGISTDGDGDRIFFVDNQGEAVEPGIVRAILSKIFLRERPGSKIAYDIRPGKITEDVILENGGIPIITKVGHSLIKSQAVREGAYFAGESSGHLFLNMGEGGCYEVPVIVTLRIMQEISESGLSFSEYLKPYQKYFHSGEINSRVSNPQTVINKIKNVYSGGRHNELDGITITYDDFWFNIRTSNTEPLIRLNLEAKTKEVMEKRRDEILGIIRA